MDTGARPSRCSSRTSAWRKAWILQPSSMHSSFNMRRRPRHNFSRTCRRFLPTGSYDANEPPDLMRIDAHLHFWKPSCGFDNRPIAEHAAYRRDFMPADVIPDLDACHVDGAILVQSAPQTDETDWCIDLARAEP